MSDFEVVPDRIFEIPMADGVLQVSPSCDIMHVFANGATMLKYWDVNNEPPRMCNVFMDQASAAWLVNTCDLEVLERKRMGTQEHEQYIGWAAMQLCDEDFGIEDPTD